MALPRVPDNLAAIAFTSNLNEKSSEAMRRLKESIREFPATTWNDVYNRYSTKLSIEEDIVPRLQKEKKLNPEKCAFGVASGKFLGFLVSNHVLKKQDHFKWNEECQQALRNLQTYLSNPPLLAKPKAGEKLIIYLVVSEVAVSAVLVREEQGKQYHIYYVSKSLLDAETRYPQLEKLALALIMASRKLRPYFQCHPIVVVTAYPLRNILHKHELSGRLAKWVIELSEYEITYQPRIAIKSQVLADFVADFSQEMQLEAEKELHVFNGANPGTWTLFNDGSSNVKGAGLGIVLVPPTGETIRQTIKCHSITYNEAEYEAMISGLELALELGINQIIIKSDSQLVVNQMLVTYAAREARMQQYIEKYGTIPDNKKKAHAL
ncbi:uncharacterized protein [Nicotiana sylvestris]|uniref:uncharacterized protein n=1 Tax=Nicotiana sylvestris TaxID=4096 RepID=UPI00388CD014